MSVLDGSVLANSAREQEYGNGRKRSGGLLVWLRGEKWEPWLKEYGKWHCAHVVIYFPYKKT